MQTSPLLEALTEALRCLAGRWAEIGTAHGLPTCCGGMRLAQALTRAM